MKKVILILLILVLCAAPLAFTACSNVSQRDLLTMGYVCSPDGYELFTYQMNYLEIVNNKIVTTPVGTMTMKFEPLNNKTVTMTTATSEGKKSFTVANGTLLTISMQRSDNDDSVFSQVLYEGSFAPVFSYKRTKVGDEVKTMQVSYEGKYLYTKLFVNGVETSSYRHKASGCYDNEMLYALVRASEVSASSYTLSYTCVNPLTAHADGMTITKTATGEEEIALFVPSDFTPTEEVPTYKTPYYLFQISTDNQYAGSYEMKVAQKSQTVNNGKLSIKNVKKIILSISEGHYEYLLSNVEIK